MKASKVMSPIYFHYKTLIFYIVTTIGYGSLPAMNKSLYCGKNLH